MSTTPRDPEGREAAVQEAPGASSPPLPALPAMPAIRPRVRVISDNDYAGDPDGLVQLAHHALSPSVELVGVIASHLREGDPFDPSGRSAERGVAAAREVLALAGREDVRVVAGSEKAVPSQDPAMIAAERGGTEAVRMIVDEALREDPRPLYVCCGGSLTEIASALATAPEIAERLTIVWIGGAEHPGAPVAPGVPAVEYNTAIDPAAARLVLNASTAELWQVPRDAYRQTIASFAELAVHMAGAGELGAHLFAALSRVTAEVSALGMDPGEAYVLGDSPLVLLTALQTAFEPSPASSSCRRRPAPVLTAEGAYSGEEMPDREITVFEHLDVALMHRDLYAKLALRART